MPLLTEAQKVPLFDLIESESRDFAFLSWERVLGNVKCFRVVGLDYVLDSCGVKHSQIYGNLDLLKAAFKAIPAPWINTFLPPDNGWQVQKRDQFSLAFGKKEMRLDKACIAILTACAALDEKNFSIM